MTQPMTTATTSTTDAKRAFWMAPLTAETRAAHDDAVRAGVLARLASGDVTLDDLKARSRAAWVAVCDTSRAINDAQSRKFCIERSSRGPRYRDEVRAAEDAIQAAIAANAQAEYEARVCQARFRVARAAEAVEAVEA